MKTKLGLLVFGLACLFSYSADAVVRIVSFENESPIEFNDTTDDQRPYLDQIKQGSGFVIDKEGAVISTKDGKYKIRFEDAGQSGFHRPHWKFHVWVEAADGIPFMAGGKVLHSVFFYDGEGEMSVKVCKGSKLFIKGGRDVLNPWKVGTIGRGNPYHKIDHDSADQNGIKYFDNDGFVGYP